MNGSIPSGSTLLTSSEIKWFKPDGRKEQLAVPFPYLAFTSPGEEEAKFIHFEEAIGLKHKGFLLRRDVLICILNLIKMQIFSL